MIESSPSHFIQNTIIPTKDLSFEGKNFDSEDSSSFCSQNLIMDAREYKELSNTSSENILHLTVNMLMKSGHKTKALRIVKKTLESIQNELRVSPGSENLYVHPLTVLRIAVENVQPLFELKKWKKGSKILLIPNCISLAKQERIAIRWLVKAALNSFQKKKKEKGNNQSFSYYLGVEILQAYHKEGGVINKKIEIHKIAELNKSKLNKFFGKL